MGKKSLKVGIPLYTKKKFQKNFGKIGVFIIKQNIMGKFILTEEEQNNIRKMYGILNEDDSCEGLCQFMYEGSCVPISVGIKTQRATNEWYKQKKVELPEYFNLNRDERLKEKYDEYTKGKEWISSDDKNGRFWIGVANMECRGPEDFEDYLNSCRKPKIMA